MTATVPDCRDAADVVAAEIEQHQMLRALLRIGEQCGRQRLIFGFVGAAPRRAGNRADGDVAVAHAHQNFRARADQRKAAEIEMEQERRRVQPPQRAVERERRQRERRGEALRQHDLEDVAGLDVLLGLGDHAEIFGGARVRYRLWQSVSSVRPARSYAAAAHRAGGRRRRGASMRGVIGCVAVTSGVGRTGVTTVISSFTLSKITISVGRIRMASGTPSASGVISGSCSISRTVS